jgi:hypothetical protein
MLTDVRIDYVHNRFQVPAAGVELSDITYLETEMRSGMLDSVFAGIHTEPEEIICIRSVALALRLDLCGGGLRAALTWGEALAARLRVLIVAAPTDTVVCYRNLAEARLEMLRDALRGDTRHIWAWAQVGLSHGLELTPPEAVDAAICAIIDAPEPVWPVLRHLLDAGELTRALTAIAPRRWQVLARRLPGAVTLLKTEPSPLPTAEALQAARRLIRRSPIARAWLAAPQTSELLIPICALLIAYDDDPAAVALAAAPTRRHLHALCTALVQIDVPATSALPPSVPLALSASVPVAPQKHDTQPGAVVRLVSDAQHMVVKADADTPIASARGTGKSKTPRRVAPMPVPPPLNSLHTALQRLPTEHAGLLFLLNLLVEAGLPQQLAQDGMLAGCKLRVALDWLARIEFGVPENDVAIAAFCGVAPVALPGLREEAPSAEQETTLHDMASVIRRLVARRLRRQDVNAAVNWLLRRHGEVHFEPAWVTLYLPMTGLDTALRRAALDLNPDFLPWLGTVVRFVYE